MGTCLWLYWDIFLPPSTITIRSGPSVGMCLCALAACVCVCVQQKPHAISALMTQCVAAEATGFGHMLTFLLMSRN